MNINLFEQYKIKQRRYQQIYDLIYTKSLDQNTNTIISKNNIMVDLNFDDVKLIIASEDNKVVYQIFHNSLLTLLARDMNLGFAGKRILQLSTVLDKKDLDYILNNKLPKNFDISAIISEDNCQWDKLIINLQLIYFKALPDQLKKLAYAKLKLENYSINSLINRVINNMIEEFYLVVEASAHELIPDFISHQ